MSGFTHEPGRVLLDGLPLPDEAARTLLRIFMHEVRNGDHDTRQIALQAAADLVQARVNASRGAAL